MKTLVNALNVQADTTRWAYAPSPPATPALAEEDVIRTAFIYNPNTVDLVGASRILIDTVHRSRSPTRVSRSPRPSSRRARPTPRRSSSWPTTSSPRAPARAPTPPTSTTATAKVRSTPTGCAGDAAGGFANSFAATRGTDKIFLAGDFNSYSFEDPMQVLYNAGFSTDRRPTPPVSTPTASAGCRDRWTTSSPTGRPWR